MSKLTDRISYLQGLAEGLKLSPDKDSHRLILEIVDVLGDVGDAFEALAGAHDELNDYVESMDEDLSDLEDAFYEDEDEDDEEDEDGEDEEGLIQYECPHCGSTVDFDPDDVDFEEDALCPVCGKELFPELPEDAEEEEGDAEDGSDEEDE